MSEQTMTGGTRMNGGAGLDGVVMNPGWARAVLGVVGVLVTLSALVMATAAVIAGPKPDFQMLGFEVVALAAGLMAVWMARGGGSEGFGLGVLGIAGAVGTGCVLAYLSATQKYDIISPSGKLGKLPLWPWVYLRLLSAGALVGVAALSVLMRNRKSFVVLLKGIALLVPALAVMGYTLLMLKNGRNPLGELKGLMAVLASTGVLIGGIAIIAMLAAGGHLIIRAFEMGRGVRPEA